MDLFQIKPTLAEQVQLAAQQSVAALRGDIAEALIRDLVAQVRHSQQAEDKMRRLLRNAFAQLPPSGHLQLLTVPSIGTATAAVLVAKTIDIHRFATPERWVGYFGIFPEEASSGVDKQVYGQNAVLFVFSAPSSTHREPRQESAVQPSHDE